MAKLSVSNLTDVHCHLVPYVDDGAQNLAEAEQLLQLQLEQGVTTIYCTPHLRRDMFETPQEKVDQQFARLCDIAAGMQNGPRLFLSREYHCDSGLLDQLQKDNVRPLGGERYLLVEFSTRHELADMFRYLGAVRATGLTPVVAHVERYGCILENPDLAEELIQHGALLQMNASSILGKEGWKRKLFCRKLLKRDQIFLLASDAHHVDWRAPNLGECAQLLKKKLPAEQLQRILYTNPSLLEQESAQHRGKKEQRSMDLCNSLS